MRPGVPLFLPKGGCQLNKERVRKALAAVSVAGLLAGVTLSAAGCRSPSSCTSCTGGAKAEQSKMSCSPGSCTAAAPAGAPSKPAGETGGAAAK